MEEQIDWDDLFDVDDDNFIFFDDDASSILPTCSSSLPNNINPDGNNNNKQSPLPVDDIEQLLLNDDDDNDNDQVPNGDVFADEFFHDILLDSPLELEGEKSGEVVDLSDGDNSSDQKNEAAVVIDHKGEEEREDSDDDPSDPLAKKRKRQLRNKDAALRSRERKKMYVKDLEMKSRYYEGECRRLGSLLQCFMAENQALRFLLHSSSNKAFNASMTKQESAVLFLESLLLGSLLWLTGIVCQLVVLPSLLLHQQSQQLVTVVEEEKLLPSRLLRKGGCKIITHTLLVGKRFKASRARMRPTLRSLKEAVSNILAVF